MIVDRIRTKVHEAEKALFNWRKSWGDHLHLMLQGVNTLRDSSLRLLSVEESRQRREECFRFTVQTGDRCEQKVLWASDRRGTYRLPLAVVHSKAAHVIRVQVEGANDAQVQLCVGNEYIYGVNGPNEFPVDGSSLGKEVVAFISFNEPVEVDHA